MNDLLSKPSIYYYNMGIEQINNNDITEAIQHFEKSLTFHSKNIICMNILGLCYYMLGMFDRALTLWKTSLQTQQDDNEAKKYTNFMQSDGFKSFMDAYNLCLEYVEKGKYLKALRVIIPFKMNYPYLMNVLNITGLLYYKLGLKHHAVKLWKDVLKSDASNKAAIKYISSSEASVITAQVENLLIRMWEFVWKR